MNYILIRHKVKSFNTWKPVFESLLENRREGGELSYRVFVTVGDPNMIMLLVEWDSYENFRDFFESEDVKKAIVKAGVIGTPEVFFLNEVASGKIPAEPTYI